MEDLTSEPGLRVGEFSAAMLWVWFGASRAVELAGPHPDADTFSTSLFLVLSVFQIVMLAGVRARVRGSAGERAALAALAVACAGAVSVIVAFAMAEFSDLAVTVLTRVFLFSVPLAMLLLCVGMARGALVPAWAAWSGGIGSMLLAGVMASKHLPGYGGPTVAAVCALYGVAISVPWGSMWLAALMRSGVPGRLATVGWLLVSSGVVSALLLFVAAVGTPSRIDLGMLLGVAALGIGTGLLEGRRSSRRWASAWLALVAVVAVAIAVYMQLHSASAWASLFGVTVHGEASLPWAWSIAAAYVALAALLVWQMFTASASAYIDARDQVRVAAYAQGARAQAADHS